MLQKKQKVLRGRSWKHLSFKFRPIKRELRNPRKNVSVFSMKLAVFFKNISATVRDFSLKLSRRILHRVPHVLKKERRKKSKNLLNYSNFPVVNLMFLNEVGRFFKHISETVKGPSMKVSRKISPRILRTLKKKRRKKSRDSLNYSNFPVAKKHRFLWVLKKGYKCRFLSQSESSIADSQ